MMQKRAGGICICSIPLPIRSKSKLRKRALAPAPPVLSGNASNTTPQELGTKTDHASIASPDSRNSGQSYAETYRRQYSTQRRDLHVADARADSCARHRTQYRRPGFDSKRRRIASSSIPGAPSRTSGNGSPRNRKSPSISRGESAPTIRPS
jgi:hypothetical protein